MDNLNTFSIICLKYILVLFLLKAVGKSSPKTGYKCQKLAWCDVDVHCSNCKTCKKGNRLIKVYFCLSLCSCLFILTWRSNSWTIFQRSDTYYNYSKYFINEIPNLSFAILKVCRFWELIHNVWPLSVDSIWN